MVPTDCAEDLGRAIIAAANGEPQPPPGWWFDFVKQYDAGKWRSKPDAEPSAPDVANTVPVA
jgi:hypothetical protein